MGSAQGKEAKPLQAPLLDDDDDDDGEKKGERQAPVEAQSSSSPAAPWQVFLCHNGPNKDFALKLWLVLVSLGVPAFLDRASLPAGGDFPADIAAALQAVAVGVVVVSSPAFFDSKWCKKEVRTFISRQKKGEPVTIVPVFLGGCLEAVKKAHKLGKTLARFSGETSRRLSSTHDDEALVATAIDVLHILRPGDVPTGERMTKVLQLVNLRIGEDPDKFMTDSVRWHDLHEIETREAAVWQAQTRELLTREGHFGFIAKLSRASKFLLALFAFVVVAAMATVVVHLLRPVPKAASDGISQKVCFSGNETVTAGPPTCADYTLQFCKQTNEICVHGTAYTAGCESLMYSASCGFSEDPDSPFGYTWMFDCDLYDVGDELWATGHQTLSLSTCYERAIDKMCVAKQEVGGCTGPCVTCDRLVTGAATATAARADEVPPLALAMLRPNLIRGSLLSPSNRSRINACDIPLLQPKQCHADNDDLY